MLNEQNGTGGVLIVLSERDSALRVRLGFDRLRVRTPLTILSASCNSGRGTRKVRRNLRMMHTINLELLKAVMANDLETAGILLAEGADAAAIDPARFLLVEQESVDSPRGVVGDSALYIAADKGFTEMAQLLLAYGANIEAADQFRQTPLSIAAFRGHTPLVALLLAHGARIEGGDYRGKTPLHEAAKEGHLEVVKLLLAQGADIRAADDWGMTALHQAATWGHADVAGLLLAQGADIEARMRDGGTPLNQAALNNRLDVVELLLRHGANTEEQTEFVGTALHMAVGFERPEVIRLLVASGADIEARNQYGDTPLQAAEGFGFVEIARLLLELGAHPVFKSKTVLRFIAQFGDSPTSVCGKGETLLYHLCATGRMRKDEYHDIKTALRSGWSLDRQDAFGCTMLDAAIVNGASPQVFLLLREEWPRQALLHALGTLLAEYRHIGSPEMDAQAFSLLAKLSYLTPQECTSLLPEAIIGAAWPYVLPFTLVADVDMPPLQENVPWDVRYKPGLVELLEKDLLKMRQGQLTEQGYFSVAGGRLCLQLERLRWRGPFHVDSRSFFLSRACITRGMKERAGSCAVRYQDIERLLRLYA